MKENLSKKITKEAIKKARLQIIFRFIAVILVRLCAIVLPILYSTVVDNVTLNNYDMAVYFVLMAIVVAILEKILQIIMSITWRKVYQKIFEYLSDNTIKKTLNNSLFSLSRLNQGEYINIMTNDIALVATFYSDLIRRITMFIEAAFILIYFYFINVYIGILGCSVVILSLLIFKFSKKKIEQKNNDKSISLDHRSTLLSEIIVSIREIKALNILKNTISRLDYSTKEYLNKCEKQRIYEIEVQKASLLTVDVFKWLSLLYSIYLIQNNQLTLGTALIVYSYYGQILGVFTEASLLNNASRQMEVAHNRINKLLEYSKNNNNSKISHQKIEGNIKFNNILYGYKDAPTLKDFSCKINSNEITCIAGRPGSGKVGIFDLLLKLNSQHEGVITIDDININDLTEEEYSYIFSSVGRDAVLFNMSIKDNLKITTNNFSKVVEICKSLKIHQEILKLSHGYETILDGNRNNLELETKTLLALAKALAKKANIYLIDETFYNLTKEKDLEVLKLLIKMKENSTIVIITNEEHILEIADNVIYMESGNLIETGKHKDIIKKNKVYENLIRAK